MAEFMSSQPMNLDLEWKKWQSIIYVRQASTVLVDVPLNGRDSRQRQSYLESCLRFWILRGTDGDAINFNIMKQQSLRLLPSSDSILKEIWKENEILVPFLQWNRSWKTNHDWIEFGLKLPKISLRMHRSRKLCRICRHGWVLRIVVSFCNFSTSAGRNPDATM